MQIVQIFCFLSIRSVDGASDLGERIDAAAITRLRCFEHGMRELARHRADGLECLQSSVFSQSVTGVAGSDSRTVMRHECVVVNALPS